MLRIFCLGCANAPLHPLWLCFCLCHDYMSSCKCYSSTTSFFHIKNVENSNCFTNLNSRSGYEPVGTSSGGGLVPPLPWEIEEDAVQPFKDEVRLIEVPHTESTKTCHRCRGTGKMITYQLCLKKCFLSYSNSTSALSGID